MGDKTDIARLRQQLGPDYQISARYKQVPRLARDERANYDQHRHQAYPDTWEEEHPSEREREAYERYSQHTHASNASTAQYWIDYDHVVGRRPSGGEVPISTLSQKQHRSLAGASAQAAADTHMVYQSRVDHLKAEPFGYKNDRTRLVHEGYAEVSGIRADLYRNRFETHYGGSKGDSGSGSRSRS
ncbi:hypothetical protein GGI43DRAFT_219356 [Trichoderma evansii]